MNILFVGDIFGSVGRRIVSEHIAHILHTNAIDLCVINGGNAAGNFGITPSIADDIFNSALSKCHRQMTRKITAVVQHAPNFTDAIGLCPIYQ